jgi:CheY-like chemotaxis protein
MTDTSVTFPSGKAGLGFFFMAVTALLVCRDEEANRVIRRAMDELGITHRRLDDAEQGAAAVAQQKFDAVIVDCDDLAGGPELLQQVRRGSSNRMAIAFALTNGATGVRAAFDLGANFVLEKPVAYERAVRGLRAAHGLMMRERRRYLRQPVNTPILITLPDRTEVRASLIDISEGGAAIRPLSGISEGVMVQVNFSLPEIRRPLELRAEISWLGPAGRAGLRFSSISEQVRNSLEQWLLDQAEKAEHTPVSAHASHGWQSSAD